MTTDNSEWCVQTVRVYSVVPHPNANKLDLITVGVDKEWLYVIVEGKGLRKVGDLVTYVSVGSLVPLNDDRWAFLRSRAEGKSHYRIRAMSLRGVKSQGIITDYFKGSKLGDDVSTVLRIEKWLNPEEEVRLPTLPKRVGFLRRFLKKMFRSNIEKLEERIPEYGVANLRKVELFSEGDRVSYTEKIHGTNIRFGLVNGKLVVGSHRRIVSDSRSWFDKLIGRGTPGLGYYGENLYVSTVLKLVNRDLLEEGVVYYGELYGTTETGKAIQKGFPYHENAGKPLKLRIFPSVYNLRTERWEFARYSPTPQVPTIDSLEEFNQAKLEEWAEKDSNWGGIREGVVVHSLDIPGTAGKWVSFRYKEI